jgi:AAA domain (dynein-related subfamily)
MSLRDVRKLLDDRSLGEQAFDALDQLIDAALIFSPVALGPAGFALHALLEPKDHLVALCKNVIKAISKPDARDYLDRAEDLAAAHCVLTFSVFFDALNQCLPDLQEALQLSTEEKWRAAITWQDGSASVASQKQLADNVARSGFTAADLSRAAIRVPHPAAPEVSAEGYRRDLYNVMGVHLMRQLTDSASDARWDRATTAERERLRAELEETIPLLAERIYHAELVGLAVEFPQFLTWLTLADQDAKDALIRKIGTDTRVQFELVGRTVDLGLQGLAGEMSRIRESMAELSDRVSAQLSDPGAVAIAQALHREYAHQIERPVIDDRYKPAQGPVLSYPTRVESYVPQAYRVAIYTDRAESETAKHLEQNNAWGNRHLGGDLGQFVLRYLESVYSTRSPLLILGHPGSGKSLLTQILAARLAYPAYTTVRVELRAADPKTDIQRQVEAQIRKDTGEEVSWAKFSRSMPSPPVVILDGYDELLQATGSQYADYLDQVRLFQEREAVQRRPVRVIVTSRITLIDKAIVPEGTTIVRLEEFDDQRRAAWTEVWNRHNQDYFSQAGINPFWLPTSQPKITELAAQPLLLLMLALYDSAGNRLSSDPKIDQTRLYHELLVRFIRRELDKDVEGFRQLPQEDQQTRVGRELERLGVAAIGMFNRQSTTIRREELDRDLAYFRVEQEKVETGARPLTQADLLLGSFFFIHESRSGESAPGNDPRAAPATFEFLHKTFGEFLTADFILRQVLIQADEVADLASSTRRVAPLQRHLDLLEEGWFGCLIHTPLHTQPNVLALLKEWAGHRLAEEEKTRTGLLQALDRIILAQLRLLLNAPALPVLVSPDHAVPYDRLPALGHLAVYSLNLVVVRTYLSDGTYVLDETDLGEQPAGCRAWDRLTSIWRSWFPPQSLAALASQFTPTRAGNRLAITADGSSLLERGSLPLGPAYNASIALADNLTTASLGLHLMSLRGVTSDYLGKLKDRIAVDAQELRPVIDLVESRTSQRAPRTLPVFSEEFMSSYGRYNLLGKTTLPSGLSVDLADMGDRLLLSPASQTKAEAALEEDLYRQLLPLSRYAAEVFVRSCISLLPAWLPGIVELCGPLEWGELLVRPAGAPVVRAALEYLDTERCAEAAAAINQAYDQCVESLFDIDTAAAVIILAWRGRLPRLCARALGSLVQVCRQGAWRLLDIPNQLWSDLADMFVSGDAASARHRTDFTSLLAAEIGEAGIKPRGASTEFLIHATRIGVRSSREILLLSTEIFSIGKLDETRSRKCALLLVRLAREIDRHEIANELESQGFAVHNEEYDTAWKMVFGIPHDQPPETINLEKISPGLTYREAMDLRWLIDMAREAERGRSGVFPGSHR